MCMEVRHNFVELLCHRACEQSATAAVRFLFDGEESCQSLTYGELDGRARRLAVQLLTEVPAGDRVLLLQTEIKLSGLPGTEVPETAAAETTREEFAL